MRLLIIAEDIHDGIIEYGQTYPISQRDGVDVYIAYDENTLNNYDHPAVDQIIGTKQCDADLLDLAKTRYYPVVEKSRQAMDFIDIDTILRPIPRLGDPWNTPAEEERLRVAMESQFAIISQEPIVCSFYDESDYDESELVPNPGECEEPHPLKRLLNLWI